MNTPDEPLNPELLDELISADLDGELDGAATDLGIDMLVARAALDTPEAHARRDALARARDLLATASPIEHARVGVLAATALAAADARSVVHIGPSRSARVWRTVAGVAASAAVIAGVIFIAGRSPQTASKASSVANSSADASGRTTKPGPEAAAASGAFGDVTHQSALRATVQQRLRRAAKADYAANGTDTPETAKAATNPQFAHGSSTSAGGALAAERPRPTCVAEVRRAAQLPPPELSGSGISHGRPVYVIVFALGRGHVAYVVSEADCSVLARVPIG